MRADNFERYVVVNKRTGEVKEFVTFDGLRKWWRHLTIDESLEWGGWNYVSSHEFNSINGFSGERIR